MGNSQLTQLNCAKCKEQYDMFDRKPMITPCCEQSICQKCSHEVKKKREEICQLCNKQVKSSEKYKPNKDLYDKLINLNCDEHPKIQSMNFCKLDKTMFCNDCISKHSNHYTSISNINRQVLYDYSQNAIELLEKEVKRIQAVISELKSFINFEKTIKSSDLIKMSDEASVITQYKLKSIQQFIEEKTLGIPDLVQQQIKEQQEIHEKQVKEQQMAQEILNKEQQKIREKQAEEYKKNYEKLLKEQEANLIKKAINDQLPQLISKDDQTLMEGWFDRKFNLKLLYRGTRDGFTSKLLHKKLHGLSDTLHVYKSHNNNIFGAYCSMKWDGKEDSGPRKDEKGFIFNITDKSKFTQYQNLDYAVQFYKDRMGRFGYGGDISIWNDCDKNQESYCDIGGTYQLPDGMQWKTNEARAYLAGSFNFKIIEIEVFQVQFPN